MSGTIPRRQATDPGDVRAEFFRMGLEYYVLGRFGFFGSLYAVAGNTLHHAVEMLLKGSLASRLSLEDLTAFGHNLPALWDSFRKANPGAGIPSACDKAIGRLHQFQSIRYPDVAVTSGLAVAMAVGETSRGQVKSGRGRSLQKYALSLKAVDQLAALILDVSGVNPRFFTAALAQEAREVLARANASAERW
jgi:hypothetical protein